jgi:hypothetical protein
MLLVEDIAISYDYHFDIGICPFLDMCACSSICYDGSQIPSCKFTIGTNQDTDELKEDVIGSYTYVLFERARGDVLENEITRRPR